MTLDVLEGAEAPIIDTHAHQPTAAFLPASSWPAKRFGTELEER